MSGVDPSVIYHRLSIDPEIKPVKQMSKKMNVERCQAFNEEVYRLLRADFIRETHYPEWLANPALVKESGK